MSRVLLISSACEFSRSATVTRLMLIEPEFEPLERPKPARTKVFCTPGSLFTNVAGDAVENALRGGKGSALRTAQGNLKGRFVLVGQKRHSDEFIQRINGSNRDDAQQND